MHLARSFCLHSFKATPRASSGCGEGERAFLFASGTVSGEPGSARGLPMLGLGKFRHGIRVYACMPTTIYAADLRGADSGKIQGEFF